MQDKFRQIFYKYNSSVSANWRELSMQQTNDLIVVTESHKRENKAFTKHMQMIFN